MKGADVFLGCSTAGRADAGDGRRRWRAQPIILALANPEPEIRPELAQGGAARLHHRHRPLATIRTRSTTSCAFPYIFRGALDCGATKITEAMKLACVREIAELAKAEISDEVAAAYAGKELKFGPDYIIPTPFDSRLILRIAPAVAEGGGRVAASPRGRSPTSTPTARALTRFVYQTGMVMRPVFAAAKARAGARRLRRRRGRARAARGAGGARRRRWPQPILIGRPGGDRACASSAPACACKPGATSSCVQPGETTRAFASYWEAYHRLMGRDGVTPEAAKAAVRRSNTLIAALMVHLGDADAMLCGLVGRFDGHLEHVRDVIGLAAGRAHASRR